MTWRTLSKQDWLSLEPCLSVRTPYIVGRIRGLTTMPGFLRFRYRTNARSYGNGGGSGNSNRWGTCAMCFIFYGSEWTPNRIGGTETSASLNPCNHLKNTRKSTTRTTRTLKKAASQDSSGLPTIQNGGNSNYLQTLDAPVHRWWRFVLAFPPHLVSQYLAKFGCEPGKSFVFDPFAGTGTTLVEAKKMGCRSAGTEALDFCYLASKVKTTWDLRIPRLKNVVEQLLAKLSDEYSKYGFFSEEDSLFSHKNQRLPEECRLDLPADQLKLIGKNYLSERPRKKLLLFKAQIAAVREKEIRDFLNLALGAVTLAASNVGFGPEIYARKPKADCDVWQLIDEQIHMMIADLVSVQDMASVRSEVFLNDARELGHLPLDAKIDTVITSPPYPNEKNYARITRLENVMCDLIPDKASLKTVKKRLLRSNSNNMYQGDVDDRVVAKFASIQKIADEIEQRRIDLNKNSGWERLYASVTRNYFGGMHRHLSELKKVLKPGANCAYVVGDQMSFLMVHIKTGELLAEIAEDVGFKVMGIDLWRERWATASKIMIREEVVLLQNK